PGHLPMGATVGSLPAVRSPPPIDARAGDGAGQGEAWGGARPGTAGAGAPRGRGRAEPFRRARLRTDEDRIVDRRTNRGVSRGPEVHETARVGEGRRRPGHG